MADWWQIAYTSADLGDGSPGGWGVKFASSPEARAYADSMLTGVDTRMDADDFGNFPTAEQLERRSRSLTSRLDKQGMLLVHSVPAGVDATGRPGNVFVHAAVCLGQPDLTAIEYWRSPDWLVPFGTQSVRTATLPSALRPGAAVTRPNVARFLAQSGKLDVLAVLAEALFPHQADPAPTVVLLVDSAEEAAFWIGSVTFLRDPRSDGDNAWSTWCRADALDALRGSDIRLIGVRRDDAGVVAAWARDRPDVTVIDASGTFSRAGGSWVRPDGSAVVEADWATDLIAPFREAVAEYGVDVADDLLRDVAAMSAESSTDYQDPLWALAAAELLDPDLAIEDRDQQTEAVLRFGPQRSRPKALNAIVDDWWRASEDVVKARFLGWGVAAPGPLLERRIVLLMAGALVWDDAVDRRWSVSARNIDAIRVETDNAIQRATALLELDPPRREEAAAILRVIDSYRIGTDDPRVAAARTKLIEGLEPAEWDRLLPPPNPHPSVQAAQPSPPDLRTAAPVAEPGKVDIRRKSDPPVVEPPAAEAVAQPVVEAPVVSTRRASWSDVSASPALSSPLPQVPPSPAWPAQASSDAENQRGLTSDLVEDWVVAMEAALDKPRLRFESRAEVVAALPAIPQADVARAFLARSDRQLIRLLESACVAAVGDTKYLDSPFAVGVGVRASNSYLYRVATETLAQVIRQLDDDPPPPARVWSLAEWQQQIRVRMKVSGLLVQAWNTAEQKRS